MDFLPHTDADDRTMLAAVGVDALDDLFDAVPQNLRRDHPLDLPEALSEPELIDHVRSLAGRCRASELVCFAGGGAYDHHVPAAVAALSSRAELATSYTPYQPELSQGVLQALFEFQTTVCAIYGMEVANASLYDGSAALVEAVNLATRVTGRERIIVASTVHPHFVDVLKTYTSGLGFSVETVAVAHDGIVRWDDVDASGAAAIVVASPNFFGRIEDVRAAANVAHAGDALAINVADPTSMGVLASPADLGADVAVGEGQSLGNPMMYGGPCVGLFATKLEFVRQVPGRIAGETLDVDGRRAYVLTLQAREQHIRRAKATSNVCTNQTLLAIAAGIHLSWLGPGGLARLGEVCVRRTEFAASRLAEIPGCSIRFEGPHFKEIVLETRVDATTLVRGLATRGFMAGPSLGRWWPDLTNCLLIAVTERRTERDILGLAEAIEKELAER